MSVATTKDHAATFKCWLGGLTEEERQRFEPLGYWAGDDGVVVFEHPDGWITITMNPDTEGVVEVQRMGPREERAAIIDKEWDAAYTLAHSIIFAYAYSYSWMSLVLELADLISLGVVDVRYDRYGQPMEPRVWPQNWLRQQLEHQGKL